MRRLIRRSAPVTSRAVARSIVGAIVLMACHAPLRTVTPKAPPISLAQCEGPATNLPDSLARTLRPRTGRMIPDDRWADLATRVPGGFAGVWYDSTHTPILMLTDPAQEAAAKQALAREFAFPFREAAVHQARWNFAQLVDWYNYILPHLDAPASADKDEAINRIHLHVATAEDRDRLLRALGRLPLPCDLVVVDLDGMRVGF